MTNVSSGSKRTWDGVEGEGYKRQRGREEPRDWRDVHLKTDHRKTLPSRHDSADRRDNDGRKRSEPEYRRSSDYGKDKIRRGDGERSKRDDSRRRDYIRTSTSPHNTNGTTHSNDEREEGEISPRHSPGPSHSSQSQASPPSQVTKATEPSADMELDLAPSPPPVEDTLAARRARRQAILAKYNGLTSVGASPSPGPSSAVQPPLNSSSISDPVSLNHSVNGTPAPSGMESVKLANGTSSKRESMSTSPTPGDFTLAKNDEQEDLQAKVLAENAGAEQVSAADYDPSWIVEKMSSDVVAILYRNQTIWRKLKRRKKKKTMSTICLPS
ncbi:hypothetical protein BD779DRAFT_303235 [Infundibulicybe gibba]|nr:hypothetical protein BD779DRAFT_303235 [Infundibulicybe gibba]